jgi:hypothetical protein
LAWSAAAFRSATEAESAGERQKRWQETDRAMLSAFKRTLDISQELTGD